MLKVILGIGGGLALAIAAQVGRYGFGSHLELQSLWITLSILSKPMIGYGAYHFAKYRGYSGGAGLGLFFLGLTISICLIFLLGIRGGRIPVVFLCLDLLDAGMPVAVLLALPCKSSHPKHRKQR